MLQSYLILILLGAIWGSSFMFMKLAVYAIGPTYLMFFRVLIGANFLCLIALFQNKKLYFFKNWKAYFTIGFFNSALPFLLFGFAAKHLSASILAILNGTTPIFGAAIAYFFAKEKISLKTMLGILICIIGLYFVVGIQQENLNIYFPAVGMVIMAAFCYGVSGNYIKFSRTAKYIEPYNIAHGSLWAAVILLFPTLWLENSTTEAISFVNIFAVLTIGILCSGIAYILYFRLIQKEGPVFGMMTAFLLPVFGVFYGVLFLSDQVNLSQILGLCFIFMGIILATNFSLKILQKR